MPTVLSTCRTPRLKDDGLLRAPCMIPLVVAVHQTEAIMRESCCHGLISASSNLGVPGPEVVMYLDCLSSATWLCSGACGGAEAAFWHYQ